MHFHFDGKEYNATYRGNRILTITRGSRVTLMFPALNLLASKGFFQSTSDRNAAGPSRIGFDFTNKFPY